MEVINHTSAVAYLQVVDLLEPTRRAALIVKKTYVLGRDGSLAAAPDPMPLVKDQLITDFGHFHGEIFFRKRGVDLCVLATARFATPTTTARVRLEAGRWAHELDLFGDRVWIKNRSGTLVPSAPQPITELPLSYARAFGGTAEVNREDVPWPDNPVGRGYYESPENALGRSLPNIEEAHSPGERRWSDRPPVAGWAPYPMYWGLRATRAVTVDPKTGGVAHVSPELFNHAHPALILDRLDAGAAVRVLGLGPTPLAFAVPRERPHVAVQVGQDVAPFFGELDGVYLWADQARVVVTWRARFHYPVRPAELRHASLTFVE